MIANTVQTESMSEPKATKKAAAGARRADVAPAKAKAGKKANLKKKAPRSAQNEAREGSKTATVLELLKRPGGASAKELLKAAQLWREDEKSPQPVDHGGDSRQQVHQH